MFEIALAFYIFSTISYVVYFFDQRDIHQKTAFLLISAGFLIHLAGLIASIIHTGTVPLYSLKGALSFSAISLAGIYLIIRIVLHIRMLGLLASFLSAVILGVSLLIPAAGVPERIQGHNEFLLIVHVMSVFLGQAAFALAGCAGALYIIQENAIKAKRKSFFFKRLPSLDLLDSTGYSCLVIGFCLLTLGLASGMIFAKIAWGRFWSWDVKEIWSAATWLVYAAILHGRKASGWRGRHAAIMAILGLAIVLFTFLGVNMLLGGHHGGFTRIR